MTHRGKARLMVQILQQLHAKSNLARRLPLTPKSAAN